MRHPRGGLYPRELFCCFQDAWDHRRDPRPRLAAQLAGGEEMTIPCCETPDVRPSRRAPSPRTRGEVKPTARATLIALAFFVATPVSAHAQSVADFYRGKTIEFALGSAAAGG